MLMVALKPSKIFDMKYNLSCLQKNGANILQGISFCQIFFHAYKPKWSGFRVLLENYFLSCFAKKTKSIRVEQVGMIRLGL